MADSKRSSQNQLALVYSERWEKIGANLYKISGEKATEALPDEARNNEQSCRAEAIYCERRIAELDEEIPKVNKELESEMKSKKLTLESARGKLRGASWRLLLCGVMAAVGICIIAWSLGASFYGNPLLLLAVSIGGTLAIFVCMEVFLMFLEPLLNRRQFYIFNTIVAAVMVGCFLAGFIHLSEARAVQMKINQATQADSMTFESELTDLDKLKRELDELSKRGMILLFIPFEWMMGVFFYISSKARRRSKPICKTAQRRDSMIAERQRVSSKKSFLDVVDSKTIETNINKGIEHERTRGSVPIMVTVIIIILGVLIASLLLTGSASGGMFRSNPEPTYYLVGLDLTGSTEHDEQENARAVIMIIHSLKAGDEFQLMSITQETFSNPEYMVHHRMPSRAGYFDEEIKKARVRITKEFKKKWEGICRERPATSIIDGLCMFSHLLLEREGMKRKLILISDMLQFAKNMSPEKISLGGDEILRKLKGEGLIAQMGGIEVYVMGASTAGVDAKTWMGVKRFWINYFNNAGASLKCYSIQRHWPVE